MDMVRGSADKARLDLSGKRLEELSMDKWISVKERFPEEHHTLYLLFGAYNLFYIGYLNEWDWHEQNTGNMIHITHWMLFMAIYVNAIEEAIAVVSFNIVRISKGLFSDLR